MADKKLDCSGLSCPMPIVKISQAIKEVASGEMLEITATDPAFEPDITAWAAKTGNPLQGVRKEGGKIIATVKKK